MSTDINTENAKQIRERMEVYCGINARQTNVDFSVIGTGYNIALDDVNTLDAMSETDWNMRTLTDFQGEGFVLDGSCELLDTSLTTASLANGKNGLRTDIGQGTTITMTAPSQFTAITLAITHGTGTITKGADTYEIRRIVVVPVNSTTVTFTVSNDNPNERVEIASITPGIVLSFDNTNLISCNLDLRTDLTLVNPTWQISSIEIEAYWPNDISEAISNVGDDVPIWYYAGYDGDYSKMRTFYLSEAATQKENLITLKGEDMSHKLEDAKNVLIQRLDTTAKTGYKDLYNWFVKIIRNAGIKPVSTQSAPAAAGNTTTAWSLVMTEASPRDFVQDIMRLGHSSTFWPRFVDAGIPKITWSKPTSQWDIYETECGDFERNVDRNIAKIKTGDDAEYGVVNNVTRQTAWTVIQKNIRIKSGQKITKNFSDVWYWSYKVAYKQGDKFIWSLIDKVQWIPNKTSVQKKVKTNEKYTTGEKKGQYKYKKKWFYRPTLYGKKLTVSKGATSTVPNPTRPGYTAEVSPIAIGRVYQGSSTSIVYPNYNHLFGMSNIGGSFTWKGDPRMQPYDIFTLHRKDGTTETCTIQDIQLRHEGGGTQATISYRKGII